MCLGVPGRVVEVQRSELGIVTGRVAFGGVIKDVNLSYTPEVEPGQYVVVHVGFAISTLDEDEALRVLTYLERLGELQEAADADAADGGPAR